MAPPKVSPLDSGPVSAPVAASAVAGCPPPSAHGATGADKFPPSLADLLGGTLSGGLTDAFEDRYITEQAAAELAALSERIRAQVAAYLAGLDFPPWAPAPTHPGSAPGVVH